MSNLKVTIAGYNVPAQLLKSLPADQATPEVISAAYARISRSSLSVGKLRQQAFAHVEQARKSNQQIVFEMGHASVAEHAVFNFDLTGVSRRLTEFIQRTRLASFTEKSQRYVTLNGDYLVPDEICGTKLEQEFAQYADAMFALYGELYKSLCKTLEEQGFAGSKRDLENTAKEDARYVLPLATRTQMGITINARSLQQLLRRLDASGLAEAKQLHTMLQSQARQIAPSLVRYTDAEDIHRWQLSNWPAKVSEQSDTEIELIDYTANADEKILAGLAFAAGQGDYNTLLAQAIGFDTATRQSLFAELFKLVEPYHGLPRAFELADFTFSVPMSSSCFAQFKRHRPATVLPGGYNLGNGYVLPASLQAYAGLVDAAMQKATAMYKKLQDLQPGLGDYALTNAHKTVVVFKTNLRELCHFTRLRSDKHAQWEIREISNRLHKLALGKAPLAATILGGKDSFA